MVAQVLFLDAHFSGHHVAELAPGILQQLLRRLHLFLHAGLERALQLFQEMLRKAQFVQDGVKLQVKLQCVVALLVLQADVVPVMPAALTLVTITGEEPAAAAVQGAAHGHFRIKRNILGGRLSGKNILDLPPGGLIDERLVYPLDKLFWLVIVGSHFDQAGIDRIAQHSVDGAVAIQFEALLAHQRQNLRRRRADQEVLEHVTHECSASWIDDDDGLVLCVARVFVPDRSVVQEAAAARALHHAKPGSVADDAQLHVGAQEHLRAHLEEVGRIRMQAYRLHHAHHGDAVLLLQVGHHHERLRQVAAEAVVLHHDEEVNLPKVSLDIVLKRSPVGAVKIFRALAVLAEHAA